MDASTYNVDWLVIGLTIWLTILAFIGYAAIVTTGWPHRHRPRRP